MEQIRNKPHRIEGNPIASLGVQKNRNAYVAAEIDLGRVSDEASHANLSTYSAVSRSS